MTRKNHSLNNHRRDTTDNAKRSLFDDLIQRLMVEPVRELFDNPLDDLPFRSPDSDRRYWRPEKVRDVTDNPFRPTYHPLFTKTTRIDKTSGEFIRYHTYDFKNPIHWIQDPRETLVCARRAVRQEVLHAKRKTGKGRGRRRRPRFNADSLIKCRR